MVAVEETKDLFMLSVQELMVFLKSYEKSLVKRSEKSVEITFQSKHSWYTKSFTGGGYK